MTIIYDTPLSKLVDALEQFQEITAEKNDAVLCNLPYNISESSYAAFIVYDFSSPNYMTFLVNVLLVL